MLVYVEVDDQIWFVLEDGSWHLFTPDMSFQESIPIISTADKEHFFVDSGILFLEINGVKVTAPSSVVESHFSQWLTSPLSPSVTNSEISSGGFYVARVHVDGNEVIAKSGYETRAGSRYDNEPNVETKYQDVRYVSPEIMVAIDSGEDRYINRFEAPSTLIYGSVDGVNNGDLIYVTVVDINGVVD
ncbi:hypothetical protein D1Z90_19120 [Motilimonas pumila]|uniref:Uncharacterized protein n=1 Tax=Motilimonas pumila TaxID=2303987 RepID=A0A418Y9W2_9GAMM|nr:hypothetical protein D1Z90_19120 [Motilimonas pumila]